ncbi:hypothetical protein DFS34DRAFT_629382, partial [Phlyctochytrium arcticum]
MLIHRCRRSSSVHLVRSKRSVVLLCHLLHPCQKVDLAPPSNAEYTNLCHIPAGSHVYFASSIETVQRLFFKAPMQYFLAQVSYYLPRSCHQPNVQKCSVPSAGTCGIAAVFLKSNVQLFRFPVFHYIRSVVGYAVCSFPVDESEKNEIRGSLLKPRFRARVL